MKQFTFIRRSSLALRSFVLLLAALLFFGAVTAGGGACVASAYSLEDADVCFTTGNLAGTKCGAYRGRMRNDEPNGAGFITFDFGGYFSGTFRDGEPNGIGTYTYADGRCVTGTWTWGTKQLHLHDTREGADMTYRGMLCDGTPAGFGQLTLENCGTFYGEFEDGTVDGWGIYSYRTPKPSNKPTIEGDDWSMANGSKKHDHTYYGLTLNGKWQGFGLGITKKGNHYVGEIRNEYRQGYGRLFLSGNRLYQEGTFNKGNYVG